MSSETWLPADAPSQFSGPGIRRSEVLAGLSYSLDLTEGQRPGHAVRSTLIGMRLAEALDLPDEDRSSLFNALLMKDLGCSSNAARFAALFGHDDQELKAALKTINWSRALESFRFVTRNVAPGAFWGTRLWRLLAVLSRGPEGARDVVRTRCERGAEIAQRLQLSPATVAAIRALDEHWDGRGQPYSLKGEEIPLLGRILGLAQTVEVFATAYGVNAAYDMAIARRGRWFDPSLVNTLRSFSTDTTFWSAFSSGHELDHLRHVEPADAILPASEDDLDRIAEAFARVIDAKSPWTYSHSTGVATMAVSIGERLGLTPAHRRVLRRTALLHDLGKLGVSSLILDKPGKLDDAELAIMRRHTAHTAAILDRVSCFRPLVESAASHHERLDGRGYHRGLAAHHLPIDARILCVADIYDALRASRPYRAGLPTERILEIMSRESGTALDPECYEAFAQVVQGAPLPVAPDVPAAQIVTSLAEDYSQAA